MVESEDAVLVTLIVLIGFLTYKIGLAEWIAKHFSWSAWAWSVMFTAHALRALFMGTIVINFALYVIGLAFEMIMKRLEARKEADRVGASKAHPAQIRES